jgi:predicted amidophosphoribosyltransferase
MQYIGNLLFPPTCLHCRELIISGSRQLCESCATQIELCDPAGRCRHCFALRAPLRCGICRECQRESSYLTQVGAALDGMGPGGSLVRSLRSGHFHLAKGAAGFLVAQLDRLEWPLPDLITSVPQSLFRKWQKGGQVSHLLAKGVAKLIDRPYRELLSRKPGDFPQSSLAPDKRRKLAPSAFSLRPRHSIADQTLLIIDDAIATGATLRCCAEALQSGWPARIYGMTLTTSQLYPSAGEISTCPEIAAPSSTERSRA